MTPTVTFPTSPARLAQIDRACAALVDLLARPFPAGLVAAPVHANPQPTSYKISRERPDEEMAR